MHFTYLREVAGSVMLAVPPSVLDMLDLQAGARARIAVEGGLVVEPSARRRYTHDVLLAQCDPLAEASEGGHEWLKAPPAVREWARDGRPIVVLAGIGNLHNLGAIARTAAFFGIARMLLADRPEQALPSDASYRGAEGGLEYLSLRRMPLPAALGDLRRGYRIVGTALGAAGRRSPAMASRPPCCSEMKRKGSIRRSWHCATRSRRSPAVAGCNR